MARSFTLSQIRNKVRQRADIETSRHVTPAELDDYINICFAEYYELLVQSGQHYFEQVQAFVTPGTSTVAVNPDYFATLRLDWIPDSQRRVRIPKIEAAEIDCFRTTGTVVGGHRVVGDNIVLYPTPPAGQSFEHLYVPAAPLLVNDSDTMDGVQGWEELVVIGAAIKVAIKEETDASLLLRERDELRVRISTAAEDRSLLASGRVVDVSDYGDLSYLNDGYFPFRRY